MIMTNLLCQGSERSLSLRDDQMIVIQIVNNLKKHLYRRIQFRVGYLKLLWIKCIVGMSVIRKISPFFPPRKTLLAVLLVLELEKFQQGFYTGHARDGLLISRVFN